MLVKNTVLTLLLVQGFTTMTNSLAYRTLVTEHKNLSFDAPEGRVSVRKQAGAFVVTVERYTPTNVTRMAFKTIRGALIAYDEAKGLI